MKKEINTVLPESIHDYVSVADLVFKINPVQCSGRAFVTTHAGSSRKYIFFKYWFSIFCEHLCALGCHFTAFLPSPYCNADFLRGGGFLILWSYLNRIMWYGCLPVDALNSSIVYHTLQSRGSPINGNCLKIIFVIFPNGIILGKIKKLGIIIKKNV